MRLIRIALADMHQSLRLMVRAVVADQPDLVLVGDAMGEIDLILTAQGVDVVIAPMLGGEPPAIAERLLSEYPDLGVVGVDTATGQGLVCRMQPWATRLTADSPAMIADAIRLANAETETWSSDDLRR